MSTGWRTKKLIELCDFKNGLWKGKKEPFIHVGVIRNTNFTKKGLLDDSDIAFLDVESKQYATRKLIFGDLILEKSGGGPKQPVGRIIPFEKSEGEFSFSNFTTVVRVKNPDELHYIYLHRYLYFLYISGVTELMQSHSTGIRNLQLKEYKEIDVPLPPLPEQKRIVAILDEAFAAIDKAMANTEKNLANAREVFESHLQSVFAQCGPGWIESPLSELCDIKHGFAFKGEFFAKTGGYVLLTPGNYYESGGYRDRGEKQKYYTGEIPPDYIMSEGDMLIAMTEQAAGLLGSPLLVPESNKFLHNQRLGLVTPKPGVPWTNEFFFHVFNTQQVRRDIHASASGVKVRHTSPKKIGAITVSFPTSIPEQNQIVSMLAQLQDETQRLENIYQKKTEALVALNKSLLHQAFAGEL